MNIIYFLLLVLLGIGLLAVEVFVPGFGVFGCLGAISIYAAIIIVSPNAVFSVIAIIAVTAGILVLFFKILNNLPQRLVLNKTLNKRDGFQTAAEDKSQRGKIMRAVTYLRPSGKVYSDDGKTYDAITDGKFIKKGKEVQVIGEKSMTLIVEELKKEED